MVVFYGYAVKKDGKYLGYNPKVKLGKKLWKKQFYKRPKFPCVGAFEDTTKQANGHFGEVVKVKLVMQEVAK